MRIETWPCIWVPGVKPSGAGVPHPGGEAPGLIQSASTVSWVLLNMFFEWYYELHLGDVHAPPVAQSALQVEFLGWGTPASLGFTPGTYMHGQVSIRTSSAHFPLKLSHPSFLLFFRAVR